MAANSEGFWTKVFRVPALLPAGAWLRRAAKLSLRGLASGPTPWVRMMIKEQPSLDYYEVRCRCGRAEVACKQP